MAKSLSGNFHGESGRSFSAAMRKRYQAQNEQGEWLHMAGGSFTDDRSQAWRGNAAQYENMATLWASKGVTLTRITNPMQFRQTDQMIRDIQRSLNFID